MTKKDSPTSGKNKTRLHSWLSFQNLAFVLVIAIFLVSTIWGESISHIFTGAAIEGGVLTPTPEILPGTPTPLPVEYLTSADQVNGIFLGVIVIAVIVLAGTLGVLLRDKSL